MNQLLVETGILLVKKALTIAFAESATAGRISWEFSTLENAGVFLKGGIVCYDACLKESLLNVDPELIQTYTPESMEVTQAIAEGLSNLIPADIHIGVTGLAAPGGSETAEKPMGTMFLYACKDGKQIFGGRFHYAGSRDNSTAGITRSCVEELHQYLKHIEHES